MCCTCNCQDNGFYKFMIRVRLFAGLITVLTIGIALFYLGRRDATTLEDKYETIFKEIDLSLPKTMLDTVVSWLELIVLFTWGFFWVELIICVIDLCFYCINYGK